jgi:hypothetical protein
LPDPFYFLTPVGGIGTREVIGHFPLPVLLPVVLPEASRRVPLTEPEEPFVVWLPADRPEASRMTERTVPPLLFWCSMVCVTRPDESRTTSRQVWAGAAVNSTSDAANIGENRFHAGFDAGQRSFEKICPAPLL